MHWKDLAATRNYDMGSPCPITHQDILAWRQNFEVDITPDECRLIIEIDKIFLVASRPKQAASNNRKR